jgi:hypothetical protein
MTSVLKNARASCGRSLAHPCRSSHNASRTTALHRSFQKKLRARKSEAKACDLLLRFVFQGGDVWAMVAFQLLKPAFSVLLLLTRAADEPGQLVLAQPGSGFEFKTSLKLLEEVSVEVRRHRYIHINLCTIEVNTDEGEDFWKSAPKLISCVSVDTKTLRSQSFEAPCRFLVYAVCLLI